MNKTLAALPLIIISIFSLCACHSAKQAQFSIQNADSLNAVLNRYVDGGYFPLIYARIEDMDGKVLYEHSAVNKALVPNQSIDGNSWFRIWSMSKIVTISLALDLVEDGTIRLNDPVTKYIPEFNKLQVAVLDNGRPLSDIDWKDKKGACPIKTVPMDSVITVLQLLNHEAGFYYAITSIPCLDSLTSAQDLATSENSQEFINRLARLPLVHQPGNKYFYGTNTTVLGFVLERATGKSLKQLVEERITIPLKINGLRYTLPQNAKLILNFPVYRFSQSASINQCLQS